MNFALYGKELVPVSLSQILSHELSVKRFTMSDNLTNSSQ